jgi:hypothetical protein
MIESAFDRMVRRAESLYGSDQRQSNVPPVYVVTPPNTKATELDEARGLVVAFLRELPDIALTLAAMLVILARNAWRWLRQWKRTAKHG